MENWAEKMVEIDMEFYIDKYVHYYGLEALEEKLNHVYKNIPTLQEKYLKIFYKKYPLLKK